MAGEHFGRYVLLHKLATGGMAEIFLARQIGVERFEKLVVIKRILPHLSDNEEFINMFLDEARIAAQLNHPHIVQIFDLGKIEGSYFIAMEYIHGEDLSQVVKHGQKQGRPLPMDHTVKIISMVCEALYYAHTKTDMFGKPLNIVHRDISPQNILVTYEGSTKLVDFGIAKAASQAGHTRAGVLKGKFAYMSPEQILGEDLDGRSDIFAVGIILYELCVGRRLFKRDAEPETMRAITEGQVPPPRKINPDIPPELESIMMKALATNRDERYPDARRMQMDLEGLFKKGLFTSSSIHISNYMRKIFRDKLKKQQEMLEKAQEDIIDNLLTHTGGEDEIPGNAGPSGDSSVLDMPVSQGMNVPRRDTKGLELEPIAGAAKKALLDDIHDGPTPGKRRSSGVGKAEHSPPPLPGVRRSRQIPRPGSGKKEGVEFRPAVKPGESSIELDYEQAKLHEHGYDGSEKPKRRHSTAITSTTSASRLTPSQSMTRTAPRVQVARMEPSSHSKFLWLAVMFAVVCCMAALGVVFWDNIKAAFVHKRTIITEGSVRITTSPEGAMINLNGTLLPQKTPAVIGNLKLGETQYLGINLEGYEPKVAEVKLTQEKPNQEIHLDLVPLNTPVGAKGRLRVKTSPSGAQVYLDGRRRCSATPCTIGGLKLYKSYNIKVKKRGYKKEQRVVKVTSQSVPKELSLKLKPMQASLKAGGKGPALLAVVSNPPGAEVLLDGEPVGAVTPIDDMEIPAGKKVKVSLKMHGFKPWTTQVIVKAGDTRRLNAKLKPIKGAEKGPPGYLTLFTKPLCDVYIDGKFIGKSPLRKVTLPPGRHVMRLVNAVELLDRNMYVDIEPGKVVTKEFKPAKGSVTFSALPGIEIYLGKRKIGQTPMQPLDLWEGEYVITARDTATKAVKKQKILVKPNKAQMVDIDFGR